MKITEQMIIEEARTYMQPAGKIRPEKPVAVRQNRIMLAETGNEYITPIIGNRFQLEEFCTKLNENECFEKFSVIAVNTQGRPIIFEIAGSVS